MSALTLPTTPTYVTGAFRPNSNAWMHTSPLNQVSQGVARVGDYWTCEMHLPPMKAAKAQDWAGVLVQMVGFANAAYVRPPIRRLTSGVGSPTVIGSAQTGSTLNAQSFTVGLQLKRGDFFCYDTSTFRMLHMLTADVLIGSDGLAALPLWPMIRKSPAHLAALNFITPTCEMNFAEPSPDVLNLASPFSYALSLALKERVIA